MTASPGAQAVASQVKSDREQAFAVFLSEQAGSVLRVARRLLGDEEAARDLAQDALLKAHQSLHTFRGEASLKTWVIRIAVNEGLKRLRRRRLKDRVTGWLRAGQSPDAGYGLSRPVNPEQAAGVREQMEVLERALGELPARQRTVLVLRYLEGMGVDEIAEVLGIGPGTVKTHLVRAVRRVRELGSGKR